VEQISKLLKAKDADGLIALLTADERQVQIDAVQALGQLRQPDTVPSLVNAMGDEEIPVRRAAARALAQIGRPAIPALVATLEGKGGRLAPYALWALGEIGSPLAIDTLIEATSYYEWRVRWSAVEALGDVGGERAAGALLESLEDRDLRVRNAASEALQKIGEPAVPPLAIALRHSNKVVRRAARTTLVRIGSPAAQAILRKEQLLSWIPVIVIVIGVLLIIFWLGSLMLG